MRAAQAIIEPYPRREPERLVERLSNLLLVALRYSPGLGLYDRANEAAGAPDFEQYLEAVFYETVYVERPERQQIQDALHLAGTFVLRGPRGSGKSTVLKKISSELEKISAEDVLFVMVDLAQAEPQDLDKRSFASIAADILGALLRSARKVAPDIDRAELSEAYEHSIAFDSAHKLDLRPDDTTNPVWVEAVQTYLRDTPPANRISNIVSAILRTTGRRTVLVVDNADGLRPKRQGRLVDTFLATNRMLGHGPLTAVVAVRNENYGNLRATASGSFFFVERKLSSRVVTTPKESALAIATVRESGNPDIHAEGVTDEETPSAHPEMHGVGVEGARPPSSLPDGHERPRVNDLLWDIVKARLDALASYRDTEPDALADLDDLIFGPFTSAAEALDAMLDVSAKFIEALRSAVRGSFFMEWHNGSIRSACATLYNFAYFYFTNRDHTVDVGDLTTYSGPAKPIDRHRANDSVLRYTVVRRRSTGERSLAIPHVWTLHDSKRGRSPRFPALKILDALAAARRIDSDLSVGELAERFDQWGLPRSQFDEILTELGGRRRNDPFGLISFDDRPLASFRDQKRAMRDNTVLGFLRSGQICRRGILDRVESLFWLCLFDPETDASTVRGKLPAGKRLVDFQAIRDRSFRCNIALGYFRSTIVSATLSEWERVKREEREGSTRTTAAFRSAFGLVEPHDVFVIAAIEPLVRYVRLAHQADPDVAVQLETELGAIEQRANDWWGDV